MSGSTPTVFVVDDELSVRRSLSVLLSSPGLKCLVLDLAMPGLNGLQSELPPLLTGRRVDRHNWHTLIGLHTLLGAG